MKTVKRIIAVVLLTLIILVVGYLCYTGSRMAESQGSTQTEAVYEQTQNI